jgi:hypothetical protein
MGSKPWAMTSNKQPFSSEGTLFTLTLVPQSARASCKHTIDNVPTTIKLAILPVLVNPLPIGNCSLVDGMLSTVKNACPVKN